MYFPLSQVTTNLYSNNNFTIIKTNEIYTGYYWKTSQGKFFTGRGPQDTPPFLELVPISIEDDTIIASDIIEDEIVLYANDGFNNTYFSLKNIDPNQTSILPKYSPNVPTEKDYKIGEYRRYFCKKSNEIKYIEIDKNYYNRLSGGDPTIAFGYFLPFNIPWTLIGDKEQVYKTNKNIVELTMKRQRLPMLNKYLQENYLKYYKNTA